MPLNQAPRDLMEDACRGICDYSIGLVRLQNPASGGQAGLGGSGTLVQVGEFHGILTACHVLDYLRGCATIGLLVANTIEHIRQRYEIPSESIRWIRTKTPCTHQGSSGPDVGFLLLSEKDSGSLKARKSFYNLSRRQYLFEKPRDLDEGIWFLCGFADEATAERGPAGGFARVTTFGGACGAGRVNQEHLVGSFDYLDFEVAYSGASGPPRDFRGFSGGGLWQVPVIRTLDGTLKVKELLFSGVAFYQHAPQESHRRIKCHGRRSIYDQVVQSIEDAS